MDEVLIETAQAKIKLQDTVRLFRVPPNTIVNRSGRSINIADPDGFVHAALAALDGNRSVKAAYDSLPAPLRRVRSLQMMLDVIRQRHTYKLLENTSRHENEAGCSTSTRRSAGTAMSSLMPTAR